MSVPYLSLFFFFCVGKGGGGEKFRIPQYADGELNSTFVSVKKGAPRTKTGFAQESSRSTMECGRPCGVLPLSHSQ